MQARAAPKLNGKNDQRDSIHKAAILVASLGDELGEQMLRALPPAQSNLVRRAVAALQSIDVADAATVLEDFVQARANKTKWDMAGIELEGTLAQQLPPQPTRARENDLPPPMPAARPFRFLAQADCQSLVPYLQKERPQTIALVLSHVPYAQAAQILVSLSAELQVAVIRRLAELDETDEESVRVVERELELWLDEQQRLHQRRRAGMDAVSGILAAASTIDQQAILKNLCDRDRDLARKVNGVQPTSSAFPPLETAHRFTFDQLAELDRDSLMTVITRAEPELVMLALAGATAPLVTRVLCELPRRQAGALRHKLDHLGPIRLSDMEAAQQELATLAAQLGLDGRIHIQAQTKIVAA